MLLKNKKGIEYNYIRIQSLNRTLIECFDWDVLDERYTIQEV